MPGKLDIEICIIFFEFVRGYAIILKKGGFAVISTYNLEKLNGLLKDFYTLTRIRITVFSDQFDEVASYPKTLSPFCQLIRQDKDALARCRQCDLDACQRAAQKNSTYVYRCHAGLSEAIIPVIMGNIVIGYLFFGHIFSYPSHEEGWEKIRSLCGEYRLNLEKLKSACWELPVIPQDYISAASHLLEAVASYLCVERMIYLKQETLPLRIDEYIAEHLPEPLNAEILCQHFQIGKTYLYKIASQSYGIGIAEHIRSLRIEQAKNLLVNRPELPVDTIAEMCGFQDYNYFITVFRKSTGLPPRKYRAERAE